MQDIMFLTASFSVFSSFNKLSFFSSSSGKLSESSASTVSFTVASKMTRVKILLHVDKVV